MAESVITQEMKDAIGVEGSESVAEVTTTGIRLFARSVGHRDEIFYDEEAAKARGYRSLVAPPGYLGTPRYKPRSEGAPSEAGPPGGGFSIPYKRILNGGTSYQYLEPVVAGDVITSRSKITEFREREGSMGAMLITYRETEFKRQDGTVVARMFGNLIQY